MSTATTHQAVISTSSVKTDAYSTLSLVSVGYTTAKVMITNGSSTTASVFRIKNAAGETQTVPDITVPAGGTSTYSFKRLLPASTYNYYLERFEFGAYVPQITNTASTTQMLSVATLACAVSMSVASSSATATFSQNATAAPVPVFCVVVATAVDYAARTVANYKIITAPTVTAPPNVVQITGLMPSTSYQALLCTQDATATDGPYADKFWYDTLSASAFTTAASGSMSISPPLCTSCTVSWTGSANDTFQVLDISNTAKPTVVVPSTRGPSNAAITNLTPGTPYTFQLQTLSGTSTWANSGTASTTTASSILTLNGATDSGFVCNWTSAYANASYIVQYAAGTATAVSSTATQALTYNCTGLAPNTSYTVTLYIVENNVPTRLSQGVVGTSVGTSTTDSAATAPAPAADTKSSNSALDAGAKGAVKLEPTKPPSPPADDVKKPVVDKPAKKTAAIVVPIVLVVLAMSAGGYFYMQHKKKNAVQV